MNERTFEQAIPTTPSSTDDQTKENNTPTAVNPP
jgi:hypothetical protein